MINVKRKAIVDSADLAFAAGGKTGPGGVTAHGWVTDPTQTTFTADFEKFRDQVAGVESGYGNIVWRGLSYYTLEAIGGEPYANSGYGHHIVSGDHAAYGGGSGALITMDSGGADFTLSSLYVGGAWRNGMTITVRGYDDGVLTQTTTTVVNVTTPNLLALNWADVDMVTFQSSGGSAAPGVLGTGQQFVLDDIVFGGPLGSISGTLWHDRDGDGVLGAKDRVVAGRVVYIDGDGDGVRDAGERWTTSGADGTYSFDDLAFGDYVIREVLPKRWAATAPTLTTYNYDADTSTGGFVDISGTGTRVTLADGDEGYASITFGTPITLFGQTISSLYVSANGFLSSAVPPSTAWQNGHLPATTLGTVVAPFWDDLVIGAGGGIYTLNDTANDRFIVQWTGMIPYQGTAVSTFQAIIEADGSVLFNYQRADNNGNSATIGLSSGGAVTEFSYNAANVPAGTSVSFEPTTETSVVAAEVRVDAGKDVTGVDLLSHNPKDAAGTVTGVAFDDNNADGVFNAGDVARAGWTVFLDTDGNGRHDIGEAQATTNAKGAYTFEAVAPGYYDVVVQAPLTWEQWSFGETPAHAAGTKLTPVERLQAAVAAAEAQGGKAVAPIAADYSQAHVGGELIVKVNATALNAMGADSLDALMADAGATRVQSTIALGIELWSVKGDLAETAAALMKSGLVAYAEPNYTYQLDATQGIGTNDPDNDLTYGIDQINAPEAWQYSTGSRDVVVGIIDSGIDLDHPDLIDNLWTNAGEIAGDGIDNDSNGYVDDIHGYDFSYNDGNPDDVYGHGTHVAGTIGGVANNGLGVTGVNQQVSLMALRFFNDTGASSAFGNVLALEYATMMGADLTNNSWGGGSFSQALLDAIKLGPLFVNSAGNSAYNNDGLAYYPANYDAENIITVAAVGQEGLISGFSQWGANSVDIAAPGVQTWSTVPLEQGGYAFYDGTSMAAPHVAGAAALLLSIFPDLTPLELKAALMAGVDKTGDLSELTVSGGILDIMGAIRAVTHDSKSVTVTAGETAQVDFAATGGATEGADTLTGYGFGERISGLGGDDTLSGGAGDDFLVGGVGEDALTGGAGADMFLFSKAMGDDTITDLTFADGDRIQISGRGITFATLEIGTAEDGDALVSFSGTWIELDGIAASEVTADMFVFPAQPATPSAFERAGLEQMDGIATLAHFFMIP